MGKRKHSPEWMLDRVLEYLSGNDTYASISKANGISISTVRRWVLAYREHGPEAFLPKEGNTHYSKHFKLFCVETVLRGDLSIEECVAKYKIASNTSLRWWISEYNANRELKDYNPKPEVFMAEARRKTTLGERREIVDYCLAHDKNYKTTAAIFDVSYYQVYSWVKKYETHGEAGLTDKRGQHKSDDEVDELERLRRENKRLKRQLEESDMLVELLKKVKEFEGM